jgi:outer membrane protein OmpA-like peptidoglycan-associated protein/tetratricopeptide (TPR) repeat protein
MKSQLLFFAITLLSMQSFGQQSSGKLKSADKKFAKLKFEKAANAYSKVKDKVGADSVYVFEQLGNSYRLMSDPAVSEFWYKKAVESGSKKPEVVFQLAQMLRMNMRYEEARKYYQQYQEAQPSDQSIDDILIGLDNIRELSKDRGVYKVESTSFNSKKSDISAALNDSLLLIVSNKKGKESKALAGDWRSRSFNKVYVAQDSSSAGNANVKGIKKAKFKCKSQNNSVAYSSTTKELISAGSKFVKSNGKKEIQIKLYSTTYPAKGKKVITELPFNSDSFSNAQPALSADGNTLYFVSNRPGGFGGSDIYVSKKSGDKWGAPVNLGAEVNTPHDEVYPTVDKDNILYFSSNGFDGLGGLDIYKSSFKDSKWQRPENLHAPVNSNFDDFAMVVDKTGKAGYLTSNRSGGLGDADIYSFTFDPSKLDYKILVKTTDANSKSPIATATASLSCKTTEAEKFTADALGETRVVVKGSSKCKLEISAPGYKTISRDITRDNAGVMEVSMTPDVMKLTVFVKEKESGLPLNDVSIALKGSDNAEISFTTDINGKIEANIVSDNYEVFSKDYNSINDKISSSEAGNNINREYVISKKDFSVNVPLTANCFSSQVKVTDLKTGESFVVKPDVTGGLHLDLRLNNKYIIEHNLRTDTISTENLFPGDVVEGPCKFNVGQTWIVKHAFYDLNKTNIRKDAAEQLDNLVRIMTEHPSLEIQLASHTDCRGGARSNDELSLNRTKAAIDYIVGKGIKLKRIAAAGFGERKLLNNCKCEPKNDSTCSEDEHQINRRTEVKVLKY